MQRLTRRLALATPLAPLLAPIARLLPKARIPSSITAATHYLPHGLGFSMQRTPLREALLDGKSWTWFYVFRDGAWRLWSLNPSSGLFVPWVKLHGRPFIVAFTKSRVPPVKISEKAVWNALRAAKTKGSL